jgi:glycerophosphoryl diester phosphodiesterase
MPPPLPSSFLARPIAHRGLHDRAAGRIENSLAAFDAAVAAGYGIELDVQLAADGRAVVFHDATLERLTGETGPVRERSAAELRRIALGGSGETIPTLSATLARVAGRVPLLIELKDQTGDLGPSDGRLEAAVVRDLDGYRGAVALMSFNPWVVATLSRLAPDVPRGLTTDAFAADAWPGVSPDRLAALRRIDTDAAGAAFVSHDRRDLGSPRIAALRAGGLPVLTWTIRSAAEAAEALRVARVITFE